MTGLRVDTAVAKIRKRLGKLKTTTHAREFRPELERFAQRTLADCIVTTPVRSEALITAAQRRQYEHRVNYIPSFHQVLNPTLIVKPEGEFLFVGGKWYRPLQWKLKPDVFGVYQELLAERQRRIQTAQSDFVNQRKQARFLYQRSWWEVARSLGLALSVSAAIIASHTRRKPAKAPPKAYGQWRGGGTVLSIVVFNAFLDIAGKYWKGNGRKIIAQSISRHYPRFIKDVNDKVKRAIAELRRIA